jgi:hypothetical protein
MGFHAQIFFLSAKPLIIFLKIKQSNGGALSSERRCKPSQALRDGVVAGESLLDGFPCICFQSQFGQAWGAVGGLNLWRLAAGNRAAGPHAFPRNSKNFFCSHPKQLPGRGPGSKKRREIQGGGGSVEGYDEEIDA